jgi:phosphate transport system substrate-binding protein
MRRYTTAVIGVLTIATAAFFFSCGGGEEKGGATTALTGTVHIDGSSTVFPITEAVAEEFQKEHRGVRVTVGISGTGGGFKKFCVGETDLNDASRPIKAKEISKASENNIRFIELPVAFDGISVLVNPKNDWVDYMTVEELKKIWQPGSTVQKWSDVRPGWPDRPIALYGPGTDSGTFDYFTGAINGKEQACRPDFTASEDDNVLVQGIAGDENALGFFGFAYYAENRSKLKAVPIEAGSGPVSPSTATINDGTYNPLSRPIFIYVSSVSAERPEVKKFVEFYLEHASTLVPEVGYVSLPDEAYELAMERFANMTTGSVFGKAAPGVSIVDVLKGAR